MKKTKSPLRIEDFGQFILLDIFLMQLVLIFIYFCIFKQFIYTSEAYRQIALFFIVFQISYISISDYRFKVPAKGYLKTLYHTIIMVSTIVLLTLCFLFLLQTSLVYSRKFFFSIWISGIIVIYAERIIWKILRKNTKKISPGHRSIFIVTVNGRANLAVHSLQQNNYEKLNIFGITVLDKDMTGKTVFGVPVRAGSDTLIDFIRKEWVDEIYIDLPNDYKNLSYYISAFQEMGITIHEKINARVIASRAVQIVDQVAGISTLTTTIRIMGWKAAAFKRTFDIFAGLAGTFVTGILTIFIAPVLFIKSRGPVFFSQQRVGINGKYFKIYKFRTMSIDAEDRKAELADQNVFDDDRMFKIKNDPRVIKGFGTWMRKLSLDEFPQFFNILKGDMSVVGTRPPTKEEWKKYELHHRKRLAMKPGLTGLWQVSGRSDINDFEKVCAYDAEYIQNWSLRLDLEIILKTIKVVLSRSSGGY